MSFYNELLDILSEKKILNIFNQKVIFDLKDIDVHGTFHSDERMSGRKITDEEIVQNLEQSIPTIINDYANGEIENNAEFLIKNKDSHLNIIGTIDMRKGKDFIRIITVIRKLNFIPKQGTYVYEV